MPYSGRTALYGMPLKRRGDTINEQDEETILNIVENQLRAGILGAGSTRVFEEGNYTTETNDDDTTDVVLSGSPSLRGIAKQGLVEVYSSLSWLNIPSGDVYYLYVKASEATYIDPTDVETVYDTDPFTTSDYLFLATIDTTDPDNPVLDTNPTGKPTGANLFDLLNTPTNPFGTSMSQANVTVTETMTVDLSSSGYIQVNQPSAAATVSLVRFTNASSKPEIQSTNELRLADSRITTGLLLSETGHTTLPSGASSLLGALSIAQSPRLRRVATAVSVSTTVEGIVGVTNTAAPRTITLSTDDLEAGRVIIIKDESGGAGTNNITVTAQNPGTNKIDGANTQVISTNYGVLRVYGNGTHWFTF